MPRKLGVTSAQRKAMLRNLASDLLWYGKIETTEARAKETRSYTEKLITLAINTYTDNVEIKKTETNDKGKEVTVTGVDEGSANITVTGTNAAGESVTAVTVVTVTAAVAEG